LFAQIEAHWTARLSLDDAGPSENMVAVGDILQAKPNQVTSAQLTVDGQVEKGKVTKPIAELQPDTDCPDFLQLQRWLLPNKSALVPRHTDAGLVMLSV
jgi:hypothetical protein